MQIELVARLYMLVLLLNYFLGLGIQLLLREQYTLLPVHLWILEIIWLIRIVRNWTIFFTYVLQFCIAQMPT